ncbi:MAG: GldM family protein [Saprospiraceae bacterium]
MIFSLSNHPFVQALGWAVLHSIWQVALIFLLFKVFSQLFRGKNQVVYGLSLVSMLASLLWFGGTLLQEFAPASLNPKPLPQPAFQPLNTIAETTVVEPIETINSWNQLTNMFTNWLEANSSIIGILWAMGVGLLWVRLLGGWWMLRRLKSRNVGKPADVFAQTCQKLMRNLGIRSNVVLLESSRVNEPLTVGFLKPLILFPAGMLMQLSPAQVEALLLHELAHIRRFDYLVNLGQIMLDTIFFYHPLFRLISREARQLREYCCDDVVLQHSADPMLYAKTLTDLKLSTLNLSTQFTMNATGKNSFSARILRIAGISNKKEARPNWMIIMLLPCMFAMLSWLPNKPKDIQEKEISQPVPVLQIDTVPPQKTIKAEPVAAPAPAEPVTAEPVSPKSVAEPSPLVAVEAIKMNVLYIGVDNPLRIAAAGVPNEELVVDLIGEGTIDGGDGLYNVRPTTPGEITIRVMQKTKSGNQVIADQQYRVKRIPDPSPKLGTTKPAGGGFITKGTLLSKKGLTALLENFDFDAECKIIGYEMTILPKQKDPTMFSVKGSDYPANARALLESLSGDGDSVFFDDIKVQCPGDIAPRNIGGLAFKLRME